MCFKQKTAYEMRISDGGSDVCSSDLAKLVDAVGLVNWQRAVKSPQEIAYMRIAARIVENMHGRILERIEPGMRKNELVAAIYSRGILGADGHGGDYPAIVPLDRKSTRLNSSH